MAPAHDPPPGTVTAGQLPTKPISAGVKSPVPLQVSSSPPQARQMLNCFRASAVAIDPAALPSPGAGQGSVPRPRLTLVQHCASACDFLRRKAVVLRPISRWQRFKSLFDAEGLKSS